jgi:ferredoxin
MPRVSFVFADGEEVSCNASTDETILAAAQAAGIPLASDCHVGDCQTCRAHLKSGKIEIDEMAFITLDDEEIEGGAILTCISRLRRISRLSCRIFAAISSRKKDTL